MRARGLAAAAFALSTAAFAQGEIGDVNVVLTGGVGGFVGELNEITDAGPVWGAHLNLQPFNFIGFELGYDGSRHMVDDPRYVGPTPVVTRHGGTALVRVAPPFFETVRPFVGAGLGASYLQVTGDPAGIYRNDIVQELPVTAGLELNVWRLSAGVRGGYRMFFDEGFAEAALPDNPQGGMLEMAAAVGLRF